jgi:hypothetical protein
MLVSALVLVGLCVAGWFSLQHYGAERHDAGYATAVAAVKEVRDSAAVANLAIESGLRAQLLDRDTTALRKEQTYASTLADTQRRVRAGTDGLRCPAADPVQPGTAPEDRPAAASAPADGQGPDVVPETAADLLGIAADVAGLVRRYDQVVERFEACRVVNAK